MTQGEREHAALNGWDEYRRLVLAEIERQDKHITRLQTECEKLRIQLNTLRVQAAMLGAAAGLIPAIAGLVIMQLQ